MVHVEIRNSFIKNWIEQELHKGELSQLVLNAISASLSGVNGEELDENSLLQQLLELSKNEDEGDANA